MPKSSQSFNELLAAAKPGELIFQNPSEDVLGEIYLKLRSCSTEGHNFKEILEALQDLGFDIHCKNEMKRNLLMMALDYAYSGTSWPLIQNLLTLPIEDLDINAKDLGDETALSLATSYTRNLGDSSIPLEIVKFLVKNGADLNYKNQGGESLLTQALFFNPDFVPFLIEKGVPLQDKIMLDLGDHKEVLPQLLWFLNESQNWFKSHWEKCSISRPQTIQCLIDAGASIEDKDHLGRDAIAIAVANNWEEELTVLVMEQRRLYSTRIDNVKDPAQSGDKQSIPFKAGRL